MKHFLLISIILALLTGCGSNPTDSASPVAAAPTSTPCIVQEYVAVAKPIMSSWTDAVTLAGSTQRINLPSQIEKLQNLHRAFEAIVAPECARPAHAVMLQGMDDTVHGFMDFLAQGDEKRVAARLQLAKQYEAAYQAEQLRLQQANTATSSTASPLPPLYEPLVADKVRAAYDTAQYNMAPRALADGRTAYNGKKGEVSVEIVSDQGNVTQVFLSTDKGSLSDLIAAAKIAFPQVSQKDWDNANTGLFVGRVRVHAETIGSSKILAVDVF